MTRSIPKMARVLVVGLSFAMIAAACGDGGGTQPPDDDGSETEATTGGASVPATEGEETEPTDGEAISIHIGEPQFLTPTNANESEGIQVLQSIYRGLVEYNAETNELELAIAESIEPNEDKSVWTITIADGWTFHNGEPVTAQNFVDTWNYAAYAPNAQQNATFFSNIAGYEDVNPSPPEGESEAPEPAAETMSGLELIDESTFEVTLSAPFPQFDLTLGYSGFFPLPQAFYDDPEGFEQQPIGTGPYQMAGPWQHDEAINVTRYEDYAGADAGSVDAAEFRIYTEVTTAFTDLQAGNLDILVGIDPTQVKQAEQEFGDAFRRQESSTFTYMGFPLYDERFADPNLRQALSMAIDREQIAETVMEGATFPAHSWISPVIPGHRPDPCENGSTQTNVEQAKTLFDEAGGYEGTMTIWFNSGAGHEGWTAAVGNQWKENLGIAEVEFESLEFAEYLTKLDAREITGPFRLGWGMDYPSPQNYLEPLYYTDQSSNYMGYSNPDFDAAVDEGNRQASMEEGIPFYEEAENILCTDMPVIPIFFGQITAAHNDQKVAEYTIDAFGDVRVETIQAA